MILSYFSISLLILCTLNILNIEDIKTKISICFVFIFFIINVMLINSNVVLPFHPADSSYFYDGGKYLVENVSGVDDIIPLLISYTHEVKYYGFFIFNYISIYGVSGDILCSINIGIANTCIFVLFLIFLTKKISNNLLFIILLIPFYCFMITQNYRDGIISIVLFFIFYNIYYRNYISLFISVFFLFYFRYEFVSILLLAAFVSLFVSKYTNLKNITLPISLFIISILIPLFIHHARMDPNNIFILPLSFVGKPIIQSIFEFYDGISYYQQFYMSFIGFIISTISMMVISVIIISYFIEEKIYSSFDYNKRFVMNMIIISYFTSMFLYSYINDGFSLRVKICFFSSILSFVILFYGERFKSLFFNKVSIFIYFILFFFATLVNVRWVF